MTMTDDDRQDAAPPMQFGMMTMFIVVTGVAVACGLIASHAVFGTAAAIALVGGAWSHFALKAGRRRLAYYLATLPMGVAVVGATVAFPLLLMYGPEAWLGISNPHTVSPFLIILGAMCLATISVAAFLRDSIRLPEFPDDTIANPLKMVYGTAIVFVWWSVAIVVAVIQVPLLVMWGGDVFDVIATLIVGGLFSVIAAPIYATLTLPLTLPLAICFRTILRSLDPLPPGEQSAGSAPRAFLSDPELGWQGSPVLESPDIHHGATEDAEKEEVESTQSRAEGPLREAAPVADGIDVHACEAGESPASGADRVLRPP